MTIEATAAHPGTLSAAPPRKPRRLGSGTIAILGLIAVIAAVITTGYAWPWVYFVFIGFLGTPAFVGALGWRFPRGGILMQLAGIVLFAGIIAGLAVLPTRPSPSMAFEEAFQKAPPEGVSGITAKRQFFDGQITILRFVATEAAIQKITTGGRLKKEVLEEPFTDRDWRLTFNVAIIVDRRWKDMPPLKDPHVYRWNDYGDGSLAHVTLLWDASTGEAYAEYSD